MGGGAPTGGGIPDDGGGLTWARVVSELFDVPEGLDAGADLTFVSLPDAGPSGKWVGGVLNRRGEVICIPYSGGNLLRVGPDAGLSFFPTQHYGEWEGGVLLSDGGVVALPYSTYRVLSFSGTAQSYLDAGLPRGGAEVPAYFEGGVLTLSEQLLLAPSKRWLPGVFSMASGTLTFVDAGNPGTVDTNGGHYAGAVLLADGQSALMVPRFARRLMEVTPTSAVLHDGPGEVYGFSGGVLLPDGRVVLMPSSDRPFVAWDGASITISGPSTRGYFSAAWSTNGYAYAVNSDQPAPNDLRLAIIDRHGVASEFPLAPDAGLFPGSHYGFVARNDGVIVGCPYDSRQVLFISPVTRRPVPLSTMTSPWVNKW